MKEKIFETLKKKTEIFKSDFEKIDSSVETIEYRAIPESEFNELASELESLFLELAEDVYDGAVAEERLRDDSVSPVEAVQNWECKTPEKLKFYGKLIAAETKNNTIKLELSRDIAGLTTGDEFLIVLNSRFED